MAFNAILLSIRDINTRYWRDCTGFHILILLYSGFWPLQENEANLYLRHVRFIPYLLVCSTSTTLAFVMYDLTNKLDDHLLLAENLTFMISVAISVALSTIGFFKMRHIVNLFNMLDAFTIFVEDEEEKLMFERCRRKTKSYTIALFAVGVSFSMVFAIFPLFEPVRRFPIHFMFPPLGFDWTENPYFGVCYSLVALTGVGTALVLNGGNALIVSGYIYFTGYFEILQHKLEHGSEIAFKKVMRKIHQKGHGQRIGELLCGTERQQGGIMMSSHSETNMATLLTIHGTKNLEVPVDHECSEEILSKVIGSPQGRSSAEATGVRAASASHVINMEAGDDVIQDGGEERMDLDAAGKTQLWLEMELHLGKCIKIHTDLLSLIDETQSRIDDYLFIHMVSGALSLCFSMFLTLSYPAWSLEMYLWLIYLLLILEEIYGLCWCSSQLDTQSTRCCDAVYFSDWTESSPRYKRSMLIVMSRAVVPVEIKTASFIAINLEAFSNVLNSAYSNLNVMRQMSRNSN